MKIILLNDNSAVSRLINISITKLGYELKEVHNIDDIDGIVDLLICDNGSIEDGIDYSKYASNILYLVPRNYNNIKDQKYTLIKPFLPTDFMNAINNILNSSSSVQPDNHNSEDINLKTSLDNVDDEPTKEELSNFDQSNTKDSFDDIENLDELYEKDDIDDLAKYEDDELNTKLDETVDYKDELTKLDLNDTNELDEAQSKDFINEKYNTTSQAKKEEFNELNHMLEEIDNMDIQDSNDETSTLQETDNTLENTEINLNKNFEKNNTEISSLHEDSNFDKNEYTDSLRFIKNKEKEDEVGEITDDLAEYALGDFNLLEEEPKQEVVEPKQEVIEKPKANDENIVNITDDLAFNVLGMDTVDEENLNAKEDSLNEPQDIGKEQGSDNITELNLDNESNINSKVDNEAFDEIDNSELKNDLLEDNLDEEYIPDELDFSSELKSIENDDAKDLSNLDLEDIDIPATYENDKLDDIKDEEVLNKSKPSNIDENLTNEELEDLSFLEEIGDEKLSLEELKELQRQCVDDDFDQEGSRVVEDMSKDKLNKEELILDNELKNLDDSKSDLLHEDNLNLNEKEDMSGGEPKILNETCHLFDIDDIDENEIKQALNEEIAIHNENTIKNSQITLLKNELSKKISEEIKISLSQADLKEALKNMKININISFEESK